MHGLSGGGGHHRRRGGGFYPYPYPIQYPSYGPWWGSERILLVEPDPGKDPCPPKYVLSKATNKCVKVAKGQAKGLLGDDEPHPLYSTAGLVLVGALGYFLGKIL